MADIDKLRPEVRNAVEYLHDAATLGNGTPLDEAAHVRTVRAELLRLTDENARLLVESGERDTLFAEHERLTGTLKMWMARCTRAEAERDALRKRIEDAPVGVFDLCYNGHEPGFLGFPHAIENLPKGSMLGQRVRLVVEK